MINISNRQVNDIELSGVILEVTKELKYGKTYGLDLFDNKGRIDVLVTDSNVNLSNGDRVLLKGYIRSYYSDEVHHLTNYIKCSSIEKLSHDIVVNKANLRGKLHSNFKKISRSDELGSLVKLTFNDGVCNYVPIRTENLSEDKYSELSSLSVEDGSVYINIANSYLDVFTNTSGKKFTNLIFSNYELI